MDVWCMRNPGERKMTFEEIKRQNIQNILRLLLKIVYLFFCERNSSQISLKMLWEIWSFLFGSCVFHSIFPSLLLWSYNIHNGSYIIHIYISYHYNVQDFRYITLHWINWIKNETWKENAKEIKYKILID